MSNPLTIKSHKGPYTVSFSDDAFCDIDPSALEGAHIIIDERVAQLHEARLEKILSQSPVLRIEAAEKNKSLEKMPHYVEFLVGNGIRRNHRLIAVGGGIIQDITCFLSATLLRGIPWRFFPTTLLAQSDSCIGSKSSINCSSTKNILGTFTPPEKIFIDKNFLKTLPKRDICSGLGEIIKVHAIDGPASFDQIASDYDRLLDDDDLMDRYIFRALEIKKRFIEIDEFDQNIRNIFNYGHSFGHAIESATDFGIPHGIAVTIGMDMANFAAARLGAGTEKHFQRMHSLLRKNYGGFEDYPIPTAYFLNAISKDKKNTGKNSLVLILPDHEGKIFKDTYENNEIFADTCGAYLETIRAQ